MLHFLFQILNGLQIMQNTYKMHLIKHKYATLKFN